MNARVALLQIASQQLKYGPNGGGRMPRNHRPDQIGTGGRMLSVQVAGSPRNTQLPPLHAIKFKLPVLQPSFLMHLSSPKLLAKTLIFQHRLLNLVAHLRALSVSAKVLVKIPSISQMHPVKLKKTN